MVPEIRKTNHSLHGPGATRLDEAEKIIQEHTGHRSLDSLGINAPVKISNKQYLTLILVGYIQNLLVIKSGFQLTKYLHFTT